MDYENYIIEASTDRTTFNFISEGKNGKVEKKIEFKIHQQFYNTYNCALVDIVDGKSDDKNRTNNGDLKKVMATTIQTILVFTNLYRDCNIYIEGSDRIRTNLYGRIIRENFDDFAQQFVIYGITMIQDKEGIIRPVPTAFDETRIREYAGYLVKRYKFGTI